MTAVIISIKKEIVIKILILSFFSSFSICSLKICLIKKTQKMKNFSTAVWGIILSILAIVAVAVCFTVGKSQLSKTNKHIKDSCATKQDLAGANYRLDGMDNAINDVDNTLIVHKKELAKQDSVIKKGLAGLNKGLASAKWQIGKLNKELSDMERQDSLRHGLIVKNPSMTKLGPDPFYINPTDSSKFKVKTKKDKK